MAKKFNRQAAAPSKEHVVSESKCYNNQASTSRIRSFAGWCLMIIHCADSIIQTQDDASKEAKEEHARFTLITMTTFCKLFYCGYGDRDN